ncbi:RhuM family protein [Coraliomargarita sp. SDUM461003]|uniref:RhuM family protein n=1 Tax=Thalassobacterium maritimum TaxID=3041265 RepID=A0ABU1AUP0_9BACT|nr:RhuM family protein [Coraliomargarita sp. SDUM461003]MDQ8206964.1 RhuM family protein [Coraliomargarita sp. SDUM461003]
MSNELIFYKTSDGEQRIEVVFQDENFWMSQGALAELFGVKIPAISKHLKNIFESGELEQAATVSKMETVRQEGSREVQRMVDFYNLDAIIAVGYHYPILEDKGKVSALKAKLKAETEYEQFRQQQDQEYISDFDREIKRLEGGKES